MRMIALALLTLSLASAACGRDLATTAEVTASQVQVRRTDDGIRLINSTDRPVAFAVWNTGWLAAFAPCTDTGPDCSRLAPGASVVVPRSQVAGSSPEMEEVIVRWWHVVPDGAGGYRAETVHEVRVPS
ncbi:hypothetical protein [Longimicrobium sp.]|jgi:hypothetical protein|uniref:hypothetical protein n=1 Tax=Longimicrobium sp. TaxID=2029185 RepID=UPI002ED9A174